MRGWKDAKVRSQKGGMVPKRVGPLEGRGKRAEKREKREERREKMAASWIHCIFTMSRAHFEKVMKIRRGHRNCRQLGAGAPPFVIV